MIVDAHVHAGPSVGFPVSGDPRPPFAVALERGRTAGIDRAIVFSGFQPDYAVANRWISRLVRASRGRLWGFACVHAERDRGRVAEILRHAVERLGLVGVKVHRRDAALTREICEAAGPRRLPILYDPMGEVDAIPGLARRFPEIAFVIPHLGSFADDAVAQRRFVRTLARAPNVFGDTSAVKLFDLLLMAARDAGPEKLVFGSDSPWLNPALELAKVRAIGLGASGERAVCGSTVLRLLRRVRGVGLAKV